MNVRDFINIVEVFNWDANTLLFELFDVEKFLNRAKGVQALIIGGATEGEREAAKLAMDRMKERAKSEIDTLSASERVGFQRRFDTILASTTHKAEPASARRPSADTYSSNQSNYKAKPDQAERDAEYARRQQQQKQKERSEYDTGRSDQRSNTGGGQSELGRVMSYAEFREGTSDKVYGIVQWQGNFYTFWGRNGASLSTKMQDSYRAALFIFDTKVRKGYVEKTITPQVDRMVMKNIKL